MTPTRIALSLALCFALPQLALADPAPPIARVTVYPGTALVERVAQVKPGMQELVIDGLVANFDAASLRVQPSSGVQVGQIVTRDIASDQALSPREAELEGKIQALVEQRELLGVEAQSAQVVQKYLEKLPGGGERGPGDPKAMLAMADAIKRSAQENLAQQQRAQAQTREVEKKLAALQKELDKARAGASAQRRVTIAVAAQQAGTLTLSYRVDRAGWKASYRASLNSGASTVDLERMAVVSQMTGEDWSGVELKLSTGQPRLSPAAPNPQPRVLLYREPVAPGASELSRPAPPAAPAPVLMSAARMRDQPNYIPPILETQGNFDTEFSVPTRANLPSDGREVTLALSRLALPARQRIRIAPRLSDAGVLTAEVKRPDGVWLSGDVQLFRDGALVGNTHWNTQAAEQLTLPFGRDEQMGVKLDRASQQSGSSGFIARKGEHEVADVFTITSFHKRPVDVLVLESSPVSTSEDVKVQASFAPLPGITAWETRMGVVGWEKTLAPNEAFKINLGYKISYPKDGTVIGLP